MKMPRVLKALTAKLAPGERRAAPESADRSAASTPEPAAPGPGAADAGTGDRVPPAVNLCFGPPREGVPDDAEEIGWIGTDGPAIDPAQWPRGPLTGLPMLHAFTLTLPEAYRRRGPDLPGIAFFQGEGEFAERLDGTPSADADDPFLRDVAAAVDHPRLERREDILDGQFALVWLTAEEIAGGPTPPPADSRRDGGHGAEDDGPNAWDDQVPHGPVLAFHRDDPNAGLVPSEDGDGGYASWMDDDTFEILDWAKPLMGFDHLGGTAFPAQMLPDGLSAYYLEVGQFGELNFGGGTAQIDLETDVFDWACD